MINNENAEAYAEIDEILGFLPEEYIDKIPSKLINFFHNAKKDDYVKHLDSKKSLKEQDLKPKTKTIITILYRNYWCNEEERIELDKILIENDKTIERERRNKYNPDDIFKKVNQIDDTKIFKEEDLIIHKKEQWYIKIFNSIHNVLRKIFYRKSRD